jgi:hypothetical protein
MGFLEGRYLIVSKRASNGIKFKLNMDNIFDFIEGARDEYSTKVNGARKRSEEKRTDKIDRLKGKAEERMRIIADVDPDDLDSLTGLLGEEDGWFFYLFSHYYRRYTGMDYEWSLVKFNTLKSVWKGSIHKRYAEFGLSKALKIALNDRSSRHLEMVWRENFHPDFKDSLMGDVEVSGEVYYDGLLK